MDIKSTKLTAITPIFSGSGTGAATYYRLLVENLEKCHFQCSIISEKSSGDQQFDISGIFYELFPIRTGKRKILLRDLGTYALQNLSYFYLSRAIKNSQPDSLLVHSSFYYFPGLFNPLLTYATRQCKTAANLVLDVRDTLFSSSKIKYFQTYDSVIACSLNVQEKLIGYGVPKNKIHLIPVMQEPISVYGPRAQNTCSRFNLEDKIFIFYAGLIKELKSVDLLLEAFIRHVQPSMPNIHLVLAGYLKTSRSNILEALKTSNVHYLGNLPRENILELMFKSRLCINLSANESISRFSLESIALKRPVLLPPNIPEYINHCPEYVVESRDPKQIGHRIKSALETYSLASYPIEQHYPENVIPLYESLLRK